MCATMRASTSSGKRSSVALLRAVVMMRHARDTCDSVRCKGRGPAARGGRLPCHTGNSDETRTDIVDGSFAAAWMRAQNTATEPFDCVWSSRRRAR